MVSPEEIRTVTFEKNMRGYRCDDVDAFLQQIAQDMEGMTEQIETLQKQKEESDQKLYILAQKIEEYRKDEDTLKTALLNAQRMGENVIREAKQKAESILREANIKADDITRDAREDVTEQKVELERIQAEVAHFKANVLGLYKQHIESLSTLPGGEEQEEQPAEEPQAQTPPLAQQPAPQDDEPAVRQLPQEDEPLAAAFPQGNEEPAAQADAWQVAFQPVEPQAQEPTAEFAPVLAPQDEPDEDALPSILDGFQGIKFSD